MKIFMMYNKYYFTSVKISDVNSIIEIEYSKED